MNTLHSEPVMSLLPRLFEAAEATQAVLRETLEGLAPEARKELFASAQSDYRAFYARAKDFHLAVAPETGKLLYVLARSSGARSVVEFGTSFGLSTIFLAAAVRDNGGGRVITSEFEASKIEKARANFVAAGLADLVDVRGGDAIESLARDLPPVVDLVLLDGAKPLYSRILALVEPRLRAGAIVVADNADDSPEYLARVREPGSGYVSVPFGPDVEVSIRA